MVLLLSLLFVTFRAASAIEALQISPLSQRASTLQEELEEEEAGLGSTPYL